MDCDQIPDLFDWISELKSYLTLNHYKSFNIINVFHIKAGEEVFKIVNVHLSYFIDMGKGKVRAIGDIQSVGWAELPVDFGHVLITPETVTDKVIDWFLHREVDFDASKEFSDQFLLLSSNKVAVRKYFKAEWLDVIAKLKNIEIEIKGSRLIAKYPKTMTMTDIMAIAKLLEKAKRTIKSMT